MGAAGNADAGVPGMRSSAPGISPEKIAMAVRMRLRPILMTSLAFILGVLPLMLSKGAGAGAQNALGTAVVGGMVSGTVLAIFFVPLFFVLVMRYFTEHHSAEERVTHAKEIKHD